MKKIQLFVLAFAGLVITSHAAPVAPAPTGFAYSVVSYDPGDGYAGGFTNVSAVLGEPSTTNPYGEDTDVFDPPYGTDQILSIGAGGSVTVKFKTPILNQPRNPFGLDFIIFGNTGFIITNDFDPDTFTWVGTPATDGSLFGENDGETRVSVSADGKHFYVLNPEIAPTVDGLFPTDGSGDFHTPVNPALAQDAFPGLSRAYFSGATQADIQELYDGSAGGTGYDISWAQNAKGYPVWLMSIRYVRIDVLSGHSEVDGFSDVNVPAKAKR